MRTMQRGRTNTSRRLRTLNACSFLTFAAVVFRLELLGLLVPIVLLSLLSKRVTFWQLVSRGFLVTFAGLEMTLPIDSYFWQKLTWPEGTSLLFNVIEGKSVQWGIMPWHFYFTSALPKLLGITYPFSLVGFMLNRKIFLLGLSSLVFLAAMSSLSHKETRFIIYIVPVWNLSTSIFFHRLSNLFPLSRWVKLGLGLLIGAIVVLNTAFTTYLSMHNYPGGNAIMALHSIELSSNQNSKVHLDDLVCQTGASRFLQLYDKVANESYPMGTAGRAWDYDKLVNLTSTEWNTTQFDFVLSEKSTLQGFYPKARISAFDRVVWRQFQVPFTKRLLDTYHDAWSDGRLSINSILESMCPIEILFHRQRATVFVKKGTQAY